MVRYTSSFKNITSGVQNNNSGGGTVTQLTNNIIADEIECNVLTSGQITGESANLNQISTGYISTNTLTSNDTLEVFTTQGVMMDVTNNLGVQESIPNTVMVQGNFKVSNGDFEVNGTGKASIASQSFEINAEININQDMNVNGSLALRESSSLPKNFIKTTDEGHLEYTDNMNHTTILSMPEEINLESYYGFQPWGIHKNDEIFTYHQINLPVIDSTDDTALPLGIQDDKLVVLSSDQKLKKSIKPLESDCILELKPVEFKWNKTNKSDIGFIAQDIEQIIPEAVYRSNGTKGYRSEPIIAHLVHSIQMMHQKISNLESIIHELQK